MNPKNIFQFSFLGHQVNQSWHLGPSIAGRVTADEEHRVLSLWLAYLEG